MDLAAFFSSMFPVPSTANTAWLFLEWAAYVISFVLILWMLIDMIRIDSTYSEEVLQSSREGEIEDKLK